MWSDYVPPWGEQEFVPYHVQENRFLEQCVKEIGTELEETRELVRELRERLVEVTRQRNEARGRN